MSSPTISIVRNATDTATRDVAVAKVIEAIRSGGKKLKGQVTQIRNRYEAELAITGDRRKAKHGVDALKKQLPGVTWSAQLKTRDKDVPLSEKLVAHSGRLCGDSDSLGGRLPEVRQKLMQSPHVEVVFTSPTGDGLKAVFRVSADAAKHAASFRAVQKHVFEFAGIQIDGACKDVARLCFMSYDPELYHNPNATKIEPLPAPEKPPRNGRNGAVNLSARQRVAEELLGKIDWQSDTSGFVVVPENIFTQPAMVNVIARWTWTKPRQFTVFTIIAAAF
jgi:hypothetical protein